MCRSHVDGGDNALLMVLCDLSEHLRGRFMTSSSVPCRVASRCAMLLRQSKNMCLAQQQRGTLLTRMGCAAGYRITACAATPDQAAFVLSVPRRRPMDETQETLRTSAFPSTHVKDKWAKNLYIAGVAYGRTVS